MWVHCFWVPSICGILTILAILVPFGSWVRRNPGKPLKSIDLVIESPCLASNISHWIPFKEHFGEWNPILSPMSLSLISDFVCSLNPLSQNFRSSFTRESWTCWHTCMRTEVSRPSSEAEISPSKMVIWWWLPNIMWYIHVYPIRTPDFWKVGTHPFLVNLGISTGFTALITLIYLRVVLRLG